MSVSSYQENYTKFHFWEKHGMFCDLPPKTFVLFDKYGYLGTASNFGHVLDESQKAILENREPLFFSRVNTESPTHPIASPLPLPDNIGNVPLRLNPRFSFSFGL